MRPLGFQPLFAFLLALAPALESRVVEAASEPSPTELSVARRLFDEGRAAEDAGRWHEAAEKFLRATGIKDTPGMRFHLARCEEEQGAFVEALVEYDRARELLDSGLRAPDVEKLLADAREHVRAKVALLTLRLPTGVQNVSVELDGKPLSASVLGGPMPLNPGKHRVKAVAVGRTPFNGDLELGVGEVRQLPIQMEVSTTVPPVAATSSAPPSGIVAAAPATTQAADSSMSGRNIVLVGETMVFAAGVVVGVVSLVNHGAANRDYAKYNQQVLDQVGGSDPNGTACSTPRDGCAELDQARKDRVSTSTMAIVGFATAGASAAAFGLTWALWGPSKPPATVTAGAAPGAFALSVSGRF